MNAEGREDMQVSGVAAAIGEPARTRMLYCLLDGHARTSTELAMVADVNPSTASEHLARLKAVRLVDVQVQGKHRYYTLAGPHVAGALEGLSVAAGCSASKFVPRTPSRLCFARTCYDHIAGALGVALHDNFQKMRWLKNETEGTRAAYELTPTGAKALAALRVDLETVRLMRRRFAFPCLDWSERRPHIGGALGASILKLALNRKWLMQDLDSRALELTRVGRRELQAHFGIPSASLREGL